MAKLAQMGVSHAEAAKRSEYHRSVGVEMVFDVSAWAEGCCVDVEMVRASDVEEVVAHWVSTMEPRVLRSPSKVAILACQESDH